MTLWMQVLPNLIDHDSDDDSKIQLFHLLLAMTWPPLSSLDDLHMRSKTFS